MGAREGRRALSAGAALLLSGCSFGLSGYSGGQVADPDAATQADAGGPGADATAPDDSGGNGDGAIPEIVCPSSAPGVILCEDFEHVDGLPAGWESVVNGALAVESGIGRQASRGLRARQVGIGATDWATSSGLRREIESTFPTGRTLTIGFSFVVKAFDDEQLSLVELGFNGTAYGLKAYARLDCPDGHQCLSWGNVHVESIPWTKALTLKLGAWHRAEITLTGTASGRSGRVTLDGQEVHGAPVITSDSSESPVYFNLGALFGKNTSEVTFDDIVVTRSD